MSSWLKRQINTLEQYTIDVIFGRREDMRATLYAAFLQVLSLLFSGIAVPESFEKFLRDLGGNILFKRRFLDHYRFAYDDFVAIFSEALEKKTEFIVTTEKDAVRLPDGLPCPVPIYYLRLEIDIIRGAADFDEAVGRICFPETARRSD